MTENINFDTMKPAEFENVLPDLFANGDGKVSQDPRLQKFLAENPDCAALVRDLEAIAAFAAEMINKAEDPSDKVWAEIQSKLKEEPTADEDDEVKEID